jgi:hypothetical protein
MAPSTPSSMFPAIAGRPTAVDRARADRYLPLVDSEDELPDDLREASHALTHAAGAADAGEAARFARAMAKFQAQEMKRWAYRQAELLREHRKELAGVAARLRVVEGVRTLALDQRWDSKLAELITSQGATPSASPPDRADAYAAVDPPSARTIKSA